MSTSSLERRAKHEIQRFSEVTFLIESQSLSPSIESFQRLIEQLQSSGLPLILAPDAGNGIRFAHLDTPLLHKKPAEWTREDLNALHQATLALEAFLIECHLAPDDDLTLRVTTHTAGEEH